MSYNDQHNNFNSLTSFFRYLKDKMNRKEQHAFERQLLNDPFEADALDGLKNQDEFTIESDLEQLKKKLADNGSSRNVFFNKRTFAIAASLALVVGLISVLVLLQPKRSVMVSEDIKPTQVEKAPSSSQLRNSNEREKRVLPVEEDKQTEANTIVTEDTKPSEPELEAEMEIMDDVDIPILAETNAPVHSPMAKKSASVPSPEVKPQLSLTSNSDWLDKDTSNAPLFGTIKGEEISGESMSSKDYKTIEGVVKNKYHQPVSNANVGIKGTSYSTIANSDGSYALKYPLKDSSQPVVASSIGYKPEEMIQNSRDSVNFTLDEEYFSLGEITTSSISEEELKRTEEYIPAEPIIGMEKYKDELLEKLSYPENGSGKKETVVATIYISPKGHIADIKINRSPGEAYSIETIKLIKNGPHWKPAIKNGLPINDEIKIKIQFIPPEKAEE